MDVMFVTEDEVRHLGKWGEMEVVALSIDGINHMSEWINNLLKRGYVVTDSCIDNRDLLTLRMEKPL